MRRSESRWWSAGFTAEWWRSLSRDERLAVLDTFTPEDLEDFYRDWRVWARDNQIIPNSFGSPGGWRTVLLVAGRGFGKTRTCVEFINDEVRLGNSRRIAIVGQGEDDIRQVMVEGESGFLETAKRGERPKFWPSVGGGQLHWPNGAVGFVYSAEDPEALRGPQFDTAWFDEPMAVPAEKRERTVSNLRFGLRLVTNGRQPRLLYSTTPKKHRWMKKMMADAEIPAKKIFLIRGTTYDNAENLAASFIEGVLEDYEGTRLGRQELHGELLGDEEGALWTSEILDKHRDLKNDPHEVGKRCDRVAVAVDPNIQPDETAHEAGVIVGGRKGKERFVLADRSCKGGPSAWARAAVLAFEEFKADEIVAEANQGGAMVKMVIYQVADELGISVKVHLVHATRGKQRRAEPAATQYDRGLVSHVGSADDFEKLETQMCSLHDGHDPTGEDFDRCDALVWLLTRLGIKRSSSSSAGRATGMFTFGDFTHGQKVQGGAAGYAEPWVD